MTRPEKVALEGREIDADFDGLLVDWKQKGHTVALEGTGAVLPAEGFFAVRPGTIRVRFGQPIATAGEGGITQRQALARRAHDEVVTLLRRRPAA